MHATLAPLLAQLVAAMHTPLAWTLLLSVVLACSIGGAFHEPHED